MVPASSQTVRCVVQLSASRGSFSVSFDSPARCQALRVGFLHRSRQGGEPGGIGRWGARNTSHSAQHAEQGRPGGQPRRDLQNPVLERIFLYGDDPGLTAV